MELCWNNELQIVCSFVLTFSKTVTTPRRETEVTASAYRMSFVTSKYSEESVVFVKLRSAVTTINLDRKVYHSVIATAYLPAWKLNSS